MAEGPNVEALENALLAWIAHTTGIALTSVRKAGSGGMKGAKPRAVVTPIAPVITRHRPEKRIGAAGAISVVLHNRGTYQVDLLVAGPEDEEYAKGNGLRAADYVHRMSAGRELPGAQAVLEGTGLSVVRCDQLNLNLDREDTRHEERGTVELEVAYRWESASDSSAGWIGRVIGTVTLGVDVDASVDVTE